MPTLQRSGPYTRGGPLPYVSHGPAEATVPAERPPDPVRRVADGVKDFGNAAGSAAQVAAAFANPEGFLTSKVAGALDDKLADLTNSISAVLPCFPAATITSLALGAPHAHVAHPPSGPPPVPPTPLPALGPVLLGTCLQVLINNQPAARCGDIGLNPTCCGLPPMFEIFTGSSKVFIGGARAARAGIDITMHCKSSADSSRAKAMAAKIAAVAAQVASLAAKVAQVAAIAGEAAEAVAEDDSAMAAAHGLNSAMMAAQMAADAAATAAALAMGKDPCVPPTGTPGMILVGSPNVLIGGLPLPSSMAIAQGLMKKLKGLKFRRGGRRPPSQNKDCGNHLRPINLITGACVEEYTDYDEREPVPFLWKRYYDSRWTQQPGPFGWGFRHEYQRELSWNLDGLQYRNQEGDTVLFPAISEEGQKAAADGLALTCVGLGRYLIREQGQPTMEFAIPFNVSRAALRALHWSDGSLHFIYDSQRRLNVLRDSAGGEIRFYYNRSDQIVRVTKTKAGETCERRLASYSYDQAGCLNECVDALGGRITYAYDMARRKTRYTDRRGYAVLNEYDDLGRCVREYCEDGLFDGRVEYLPEARCAIVTHASDGATATVFFDENHVLTEYITPSGGKIEFVTDEQGRVTEERDALGNVTKLLYDGWGGNIGRQDPLGYVHPPSHIDPNPPNPLAYHLPEWPLEWEHGALVKRDHIIDKPNRGHSRPLDWLPATVVDTVLQLVPDRNGVSEGAAREGGETAQIRDALQRKIEECDAEGHRRRWKYDPEGNVLEYQDRDGSVERYAYKSWNLLDQKLNAIGAAIRYDYSPRAEVTQVIDGCGTVHQYAYDQWDRLVEVRRHDRVKERYRYDLADNLIEKTDGHGRTLLAFEIAPGNLNAVRRLSSGENHCFEYGEGGRIVRAATDELETTFAYDGLGRQLADKRDGLGVQREFITPGLSTTTYLGKFAVHYRRLTEGLFTLTDPTGNAHRLRYSRTGVFVHELANGTNHLSCYNSRGQCRYKATVPRDGSTATWQTRYSYSAEGDLLAVEGSGGTTHYRYDPAHRLVGEILPTGEEREFAYDLANNLIHQPGLEDVSLLEGNRLQWANGDRFTYNERNHVSARHGPRTDQEFEYDSLDRLVASTINGERWTARYDPLCRLVSKTWRGQTTTYYWHGFRLAAEIRPNGSLRLYLYVDQNALVPFMSVEYESLEADPASGKSFFFFTNQIGVPVRAEDIHGRQVWQARVDPYGRADVRTGSSIDIPLRFPGHYLISEIDLHYNRFRYYSPELGRYLQSDPLGIRGGLNLYGYSVRPLTKVDLDGLTEHEDQRKKQDLKNGEAGANAEGVGQKQDPAAGSEKKASGYPPPRTAKARKECQKVIDVMGRMDKSIGRGRLRTVDVLTHADGTVSVGLSASDSDKNRTDAARLQNALNGEGQSDKYRVRVNSNVPNIVKAEGGNDPGQCAEPHSAEAAHGHDSPVDGQDTRWRGKDPNPHPYKGSNADGAPVEPSQMDPCPTCKHPPNAEEYGNYANS
jgi:RHS repeat-associated protein